MPSGADAVWLLCRRLGVPDEDDLSPYAKGRMERELLPMLRSAMVRADDPCVYAVIEDIVLADNAIQAARHLDGAASEMQEASKEALDAARAWAENRVRELAVLDARRASMDKRQEALDARQASLDERQAALDRRQEALDARQAALDEERRALDARQAALDAHALRLSADASKPLLSRWFGGGREGQDGKTG